MQLSKIETTQVLRLPTALREGNLVTISRAIFETNIEKIEATVRKRIELEDDLEELRVKWKHANAENRISIELQARDLIATIEAMPEFPSLKAMARRQSTDEVLDDLCILLSWFNDQLNMANKLNADQIEVTALAVINEYGHLLRIEDIAACIKQALRGTFGQIYARLDAAVILEWLSRYESELMKERMNRAADRHANMKESRHTDREVNIDKAAYKEALITYIRNQKT